MIGQGEANSGAARRSFDDFDGFLFGFVRPGAARSAKGLSELVRHCLGRPLDKREQFSDWERRPLRPTQLAYAGKLLAPSNFLVFQRIHGTGFSLPGTNEPVFINSVPPL